MTDPRSTVAAAAERLETALAGRYRIERELGEGGMATVYLVHDLKHDRKVALKVLKPEIAQTLGTERFNREIQLAPRLSHPALRSMPEHRAMLREIRLPGVMND